MGFVKDVVKGIAPLLFGGVLGLALSKSKKKVQARPVTRASVREEAEREDELRRRRGAGADMVTGMRGAEAPGSSIGRLVVGS